MACFFSFFFFSRFQTVHPKEWGDTPLPEEEEEALAKMGGMDLNKPEKDKSTLHPADANSKLELVKGDRLMSAESWQDLGLKPELQSALSAMRFNRPSKIQAAALPVILGRGGVKKQSFIGQAQSGSGKTAAFVLGFLEQITEESYPQVSLFCRL